MIGPSAGITMATSLLSLALDRPLDPTIAMTGELTVTGKVLRIGGLREKTVAARRAGAKTIIFPSDNMSDWLELPPVSDTSLPLHTNDADHYAQNIKEGIDGHAASWYSDVFDLVFPDLEHDRASNVWAKQLAKPNKEDARSDGEES